MVLTITLTQTCTKIIGTFGSVFPIQLTPTCTTQGGIFILGTQLDFTINGGNGGTYTLKDSSGNIVNYTYGNNGPITGDINGASISIQAALTDDAEYTLEVTTSDSQTGTLTFTSAECNPYPAPDWNGPQVFSPSTCGCSIVEMVNVNTGEVAPISYEAIDDAHKPQLRISYDMAITEDARFGKAQQVISDSLPTNLRNTVSINFSQTVGIAPSMRTIIINISGASINFGLMQIIQKALDSRFGFNEQDGSRRVMVTNV